MLRLIVDIRPMDRSLLFPPGITPATKPNRFESQGQWLLNKEKQVRTFRCWSGSPLSNLRKSINPWQEFDSQSVAKYHTLQSNTTQFDNFKPWSPNYNLSDSSRSMKMSYMGLVFVDGLWLWVALHWTQVFIFPRGLVAFLSSGLHVPPHKPPWIHENVPTTHTFHSAAAGLTSPKSCRTNFKAPVVRLLHHYLCISNGY